MNPLPPVSSLSSLQQRSLQNRLETLLIGTIKKNCNTIYFREAPLLSDLRGQLTPASAEDTSILTAFSTLVPLSTYEDYRPFVVRFLRPTPYPSHEVRDLLSPGLPLFIAQSSGTSGSEFKYFPKYPHALFKQGPPSSPPGGAQLKTAALYGLHSMKTIEFEEDGADKIPVTIITSGFFRVIYGITPDNESKMAIIKRPSAVAPLAVGLITSKAGLLSHLLFAVAERSLGTITTSFTTVLSDSLSFLEDHWEDIITAIEKGILPDILDYGEYRPCLEMHLQADPTRAAELRQISVGKQGWLNEVWPDLQLVRASASGVQFSAPVPKLRHAFGDSVSLRTRVLGSSECSMGVPYDASDLNLYKIRPYEYMEFLPSEEDSYEHLVRTWDVETRKQYEIIVTTQDGLWRYRIGDIVEVAGFDPEDSMPLVRFIERRGCKVRIAGEFVNKSLLGEAVKAMEVFLKHVVQFTVEADTRKRIGAYGFFVELEEETGLDVDRAPMALQETLMKNSGYAKWSNVGRIGVATVRIVSAGAFARYRVWKAQASGTSGAQIKVPVSIADAGSKEFFSNSVIRELVFPL